MSTYRFAALLPLTIALAACGGTPEESATDAPAETATTGPEELGTAQLAMADGTPAGTATLLADGDAIEVSVNATGLEEGEHGFHLHQTGTCDAPDFKSAGGHLNPDDKEHGTENPNGAHMGDMPNLTIGADGTGSATVTLDGDRDHILDSIFDDDGTAVVIHAGPDDYKTDPAGDAGSRMACGVMEKPAATEEDAQAV
ncbi:superoxide dismutase family protein [Altericroceibacterium spongiae]|uniref:Superoxide dismutase family protein n=1 Tax=Altericroceibacterium spongiae TaxID=2320269 RepID=A0A420EIM9_9SPHN|nr:superoxide dismutase family protein [Altericroceibacterium spongiae]RKF20571.1 superoxide dismutase family protein [Altericroceibacterium spongiae]